jgi:hypothetical protein
LGPEEKAGVEGWGIRRREGGQEGREGERENQDISHFS